MEHYLDFLTMQIPMWVAWVMFVIALFVGKSARS